MRNSSQLGFVATGFELVRPSRLYECITRTLPEADSNTMRLRRSLVHLLLEQDRRGGGLRVLRCSEIAIDYYSERINQCAIFVHTL